MYQQRPQPGSHGNVQATSVYLKMMPFNTTEQQVRMALGTFGTIQHVTMINDKEAQGFNPCAIVYYNNSQGAECALHEGSVMINNATVKINPHVKKQ